MTTPEVGQRFMYVGCHNMAGALTGKPCTLAEVYDQRTMWNYRVRFDDGTESVAVDADLAPILADGSIGERMQPEAGARRGWDGYQKMLKHSDNKIIATMGESLGDAA